MAQHIAPKAPWTFIQKALFRGVLLFVLLFVLSFSFPHYFIPDAGAYTNHVFEKAATWFGHTVLGLHHYTTELVSDSIGFYINTLFLFIVSLLLSIVWWWIDKQRPSYNLLAYFFSVGIRYYLCMQLLAYGFSKVFKVQFYLPEPNLLYTPLGMLHRDILYWSTMGVSRTYSIITGSVEIAAALLLLFRKTALAGTLAALIAMLNIFIINISFDISVKLYSLFLLLLCSVLLAPYLKGLYCFLNQEPYKPVLSVNLVSTKFRKPYLLFKIITILLLLADAVMPYVKSGNYNDDKAPRPHLHGAYEVSLFVRNGDTLPPLLTDTLRWRRVFIHRQRYFIAQYMNDSMEDYGLNDDSTANTLWVSRTTDSVEQALHYRLQADSLITVTGVINGDRLLMTLKRLDTKSLPALLPSFHWTIDQQ